MNKKIVKYLFITVLATVIFSSCQKYYLDGGTHKPKYEGTVLDYIKMRKDVFDSLYRVIKIAGMEEVLNREGVTFFAPGDPSIRRALYELNFTLYLLGKDTVTRMEQIDASVWKEYLSMYIYTNTYLLKDIPQLDTNNMNVFPGQGFLSWGNQNMNIGVNYNDVVAPGGQVVEYAGYRQLFLSYILDAANVGSRFGMIPAPVATSDIQTKNGVIHALEYRRHIFGFLATNFVSSAYSKGIKY